MRYTIKKQFALFALVGGGVLLFGTFMMHVLVDWFYWDERAANATQLIVTLWLNFKLNKRFSFTGCESPGMAQRFLLFRIASLLVSFGLFDLSQRLGFNHVLSTLAIGIIVGLLVNFLTSRKWVFTEKTRADMLANLEKYRLDRRTAISLGVSFAVACVLLFWLTGTYFFVTALLVLLSLLCLAMAMFFFVTLVYPQRDQTSAYQMGLPQPTGQSQESVAILMPARKGEPQQYAYTLLNAAWTQRRHPNYRLVPLIYDDDLDGARNILAVCQTLQEWRDSEFQLNYADLKAILTGHLSRTPQDGSKLTSDQKAYFRRTISEDHLIQVVRFPVHRLTNGQKRSKPIKLNFAFQMLKDRFSVFGILDAETLAAEDLLVYVDQAFQDNPDRDVVQFPVQLMEPHFSGDRSDRTRQFWRRWYSWQNLLEYLRCFMGLMPLQAAIGYLSWGGNTIFVRTTLLQKLGGWPNTLTEDNAAGTKAAVFHGAKSMVVFDPKLASHEETPPTLRDLIKQRIRWNQGFLQTLMEGEWRLLPTLQQRLMAFWIMASPFMQAIAALLMFVTALTVVFVKALPVFVLVMYLPVMTMVVSMVLLLKQMREFSKMYDRRVAWYVYPFLLLTMVPYQLVLGYAALRAIINYIKNNNEWHSPLRAGDNIAAWSEAQPVAARS